MRRMLLLFILFGLACSSTNGAISGTATPLQSTPSILPATSTSTVEPPPTSTPQPIATPLPAVISPENAARLVVLKEISLPSLRRVVFSPTGIFFATASGNDADFGVTTWSIQAGKRISSFPYYTGIVWDLAFSPDGKLIASAAADAGNSHVGILDAFSGKQILVLDGPKISKSVSFSPDGKKVGGRRDEQLSPGCGVVYDTFTWQRTQELSAPGQNVTALVFSYNGSQLVSSGTEGKIRVWSLASGTVVKELFRGKQMNRLSMSPDGSLLASDYCDITGTNGCTRGGVVIWHTTDWGILQQFNDLAEGLAFSSDWSFLVNV